MFTPVCQKIKKKQTNTVNRSTGDPNKYNRVYRRRGKSSSLLQGNVYINIELTLFTVICK